MNLTLINEEVFIVVPIAMREKLQAEAANRGRSSTIYLDQVMKLNESGDTRQPITHIGVRMTVYQDDLKILLEEASKMPGSRYIIKTPWEDALKELGLKEAKHG